MLLDLRGGFRVLGAHVAAVGGAGWQRDDAAARRSRSSRLGRALRCARTEGAAIGAECWIHQKVTTCLALNNATSVLMTRPPGDC